MRITEKYLYAILCGILFLSILGGCSGGSSSHGTTPAALASIEVTPTNPSIAIGTTQQFKATGIYSDKTKKDLTSSVTWSSLSPAIATVSDTVGSKGLATAFSEGSTTITATSGAISGSTTLTVKAATVTLVSIEVTPTNPSIALGTKQQFTATGIFSDNSKQDLTTQVTWSSSDISIATINSAGLATSVGAGSATITAASGSASGNATLTVKAAIVTLDSIEVTPTNPSIALGTTQQFTATGIFSDNSKQDLTTQVTWSSSNIGVTTIDNAGLATSVSAGSTTVAAALGSVSGNTTLTVTSATLVSIGISPTNPSISLGTGQQFTATGVFSDGTTHDLTTSVTWGSSDSTIATISNALGSEGLATSVAAGSATITASLGGISGETTLTVTAATLSSIEVTPTNQSLPNGLTLQYTATGIYSDNTTQDLTTQVTWSSSAETFATISNADGSEGLATAVGVGLTTVRATLGSVYGETALTVTAATLSSISVTPASQSIAKGLTLQYTATGTYSDSTTQDLTTQVTWSSSAETFATISNADGSEGLATAVGVGLTTIRATLGSVFGETALTVTDATLGSITVTPTNQTMALGTKLQYTATGIFSDSTQVDLTKQVTWSSSNTGVAVISNGAQTKGLATAIGVGSTTIRATFGDKTGSTTLTVITTAFDFIEVTPANSTIAVGDKLQFTATGHFPDGSTQNLTLSVTWSSSVKTVATISNARKTRGMATGVSAGSTTIRATTGGMFGTTTLTVSP